MFPEETLVKILSEKSLKIATAESCTGGLLAKKITDVPGSSAVFDMGIVSYSNEIKNKFLGVPEEILRSVGAVSAETAEAMAKGVCGAAEADIGVGITGIAGPGGGTPEKPVGLVYLCVYFKKTAKTVTKKLNLQGGRAAVREQTAETALETVLGEI